MEAAKTWFGEVVSKGVQVIKDAIKVLQRIRGIEEMLHDLIASLNQEANTLKEIMCKWDVVASSDLDGMIACGIVPSCEMFYRCQGLMGYKKETLRKLITKLQAALEDCQSIEAGPYVI